MSKNIVNINDKKEYARRKEVLTSFFSDKEYKYLTQKQIMNALSIPKKDKETFENILLELENEGVIFKKANGKYVKIDNNRYFTCVYQAKNGGFGFGNLDDGTSIHIAFNKVNGAMNGDTIVVEIIGEKGKSPEGEVVKVIKRNNQKVIGEFQKSKNFGFVVPLDNLLSDIYIPKKESLDIKNEEIVEVQITKYPTNKNRAEGKITKVIGNSSDSHIYEKALYMSYNLKDFDSDIEEELKDIPDFVTDDEKIGRVDRRDKVIFTIDASDAKDLDDAVGIEKRNDGSYLLSVYIADVSHYVKENSKLDKEAIKRGTSIYIPGKVIPMLPKKLSNGICSLNAGEDRLSLAVDMVISKDGNVLESNIFKALIKVSKKMSYDKVYKVITNDMDESLEEEYGKYKDELMVMSELAHILRDKRMREGCINFDIPETHVVLDENGDVKTIEPYEITFANSLVEEFMLVTNMVVAEKCYYLQLPFIYRIHEKIDDEKIRELNHMLSNYNLRIKGTSDIHPKALSSILDSIEDENEKKIISTYMLRSMKVAKYSNECLGHFGLNAKFYCHFTSPIRRYPDLFIHRIISNFLEDKNFLNEKRINKYEIQAEEYANSSSIMERNATKIERDFIDLYSAIYMKKFEGEKFDASISSITSFGMFITLDSTIEGFVSYTNIPEHVDFDEKNKVLNVSNSKKVYKIGDRVKVVCLKSDIKSKEIDFKIIK